ncbi:MAG: ABC transporter permease subunit [Methanomassiliicoccales archaeon]|nr:ABC transporter permease subunit [Methanomassiliicoccales archaeon]
MESLPSGLAKLTAIVSRRRFRAGWTAFIIFFFLVFVVLPTVYVLSYAVTDWDQIQNNVLNNQTLTQQIGDSIAASFEIAGIVTVVDILVGLPMAWIMVRKNFRGKRFIDTLIDMPLAVPTAALGFSSAIFFAVTKPGLDVPLGLDLVASPFILIVLLHIVFSYPYMVRSLSAILEQIDQTYETAGRTLGASKLTAARTITLPLFRAGLVTGIILCFSRSLSETGGTVIALATMANAQGFNTGPTLINFLKGESGTDPAAIPAMAFVSILLILLAIVLLVVLKLLVMKVRLPAGKVWPKWEKLLSRGWLPKSKDGIAIAFLVVFVLVPAFFIFTYVFTSSPTAAGDWNGFYQSLGISFIIAGVVTAIDLALGIPLALYIARGGKARVPAALDVLVNIPLIVPTAALGFSLGLFWTGSSVATGIVAFILVILAHVAFTYPLVVRNVTGAVEEIDPAFEETARTLGAKPIQGFRRVLYPMIKSSILAGAIMAFTRSLGETGATLAVAPSINTAPVFIVNLISPKTGQPDYYTAALACIVLIILSYVIMLSLRYLTRRRRKA